VNLKDLGAEGLAEDGVHTKSKHESACVKNISDKVKNHKICIHSAHALGSKPGACKLCNGKGQRRSMDLEHILVILTNLLKRGAEDGLEDSAHYENCATGKVRDDRWIWNITHELEVEA
jgi:hypothetical protein